MSRILNWKSLVAVLALVFSGMFVVADSSDHCCNGESIVQDTVGFISQVSRRPSRGSRGDSADMVATANSTLTAELVWSPTVKDLAWSEIRPSVIDKAWLESDYLETSGMSEDHVVAKGLVDIEPALEVATDKYILPRLSKFLPLESPWNASVARSQIRRELERSPIVVDEVTQTFYRSVGSDQLPAFTREAVLLDLSNENIRSLVSSVEHTIHRRQQVQSGALKFALAAIAITCVVCWVGNGFLNRVTQGYYVWPIRLATGMILFVSFGLTAKIAISILQAL